METLISCELDESEAVEVMGGHEGKKEYFYRDLSKKCTIQALLHFVRVYCDCGVGFYVEIVGKVPKKRLN